MGCRPACRMCCCHATCCAVLSPTTNSSRDNASRGAALCLGPWTCRSPDPAAAAGRCPSHCHSAQAAATPPPWCTALYCAVPPPPRGPLTVLHGLHVEFPELEDDERLEEAHQVVAHAGVANHKLCGGRRVRRVVAAQRSRGGEGRGGWVWGLGLGVGVMEVGASSGDVGKRCAARSCCSMVHYSLGSHCSAVRYVAVRMRRGPPV